MGILLGQLPPAELARLKAELAETLIANFCYPRFFDYRTGSLRMRPVDRTKRQEVWLYLSSVDFTAWSRVDLMSPDFQRYIERLLIQFVKHNRSFFGQQGRKRMPDVRMLINACSSSVTEGLRGHLTGRHLTTPPFGSPRPVTSWATTNAMGRPELGWEQIASLTMLLQQQLQELRGEIKASVTTNEARPASAINRAPTPEGAINRAPTTAKRSAKGRTSGNGASKAERAVQPSQPLTLNVRAPEENVRSTAPLPGPKNTTPLAPPTPPVSAPAPVVSEVPVVNPLSVPKEKEVPDSRGVPEGPQKQGDAEGAKKQGVAEGPHKQGDHKGAPLLWTGEAQRAQIPMPQPGVVSAVQTPVPTPPRAAGQPREVLQGQASGVPLTPKLQSRELSQQAAQVPVAGVTVRQPEGIAAVTAPAPMRLANDATASGFVQARREENEDIAIFEQLRHQLIVWLRVEVVRSGADISGQGPLQLLELLRQQESFDETRLQVVSTLLNLSNQVIANGYASLLDYKQGMLFYLMHTRR